jgi:hypothetical protein
MKILYYGAGWPTNIGNAFIDLGAMALLKEADPNATVGFASEMPRWFFNQKGTMSYGLDVAAYTECDVVAFSGMAMCPEFVEVNGPTIKELDRKGTKILLMGTGAQSYSESDQNVFGDFLEGIRTLAFISRDDNSFDMFADRVTRPYRGIDCAFFLPEAFTPFKMGERPYIVYAFDSRPTPWCHREGYSTVFAHHNCWSGPRSDYDKSFTLISDIPYDYLTLYANAAEVHSDRVHACVAGLSYGVKTRFYNPTPRGSLFPMRYIQIEFMLVWRGYPME